jgi:hypothetical protein
MDCYGYIQTHEHAATPRGTTNNKIYSCLLTPIFSESGCHEFPLKSIPGCAIFTTTTLFLLLLLRGANADEYSKDASTAVILRIENFIIWFVVVVDCCFYLDLGFYNFYFSVLDLSLLDP